MASPNIVVETPTWDYETQGSVPGSSTITKVPIAYARNCDKPRDVVWLGWAEDMERVAYELSVRNVDAAFSQVTYPNSAKLSSKLDDGTRLTFRQAHAKGSRAVAEHIIGRNDDNQKLRAIAHSAAGGQLIEGLHEDSELWETLDLHEPHGIAKPKPEASVSQQSKIIIRRAQAAGMFKRSSTETGSRQLFDLFMAGLAYGLDEDGAGKVQKLYDRGIVKHISIGGRDQIYRPHEYYAALPIPGIFRLMKGVEHISHNHAKAYDHLAKLITNGTTRLVSLPKAA